MKKVLIAILLMIFAFAEVSAKINQTGYRWRNDDGNETTATWKAPEGQPVYLGETETIRLRLQVAIPAEELNPYNEDMSLYYSSGTFGSPWQKITADPGNVFVLFNSPHLSDLFPTTRQLSAQPESFQHGVFFDSTFDHTVSLPVGNYSEYEWAFRPSETAGPNVYYFAMGFDVTEEPIIIGVGDDNAARLHYKVHPAGVPLKKWSVYATLVLLAGFVLIRYRKLL